MSGRYSMARGWQDHPLFDGDEFSRRDAFEWLISEAAWKETRRRIGGQIITLRRGQLTHSVRFMAQRWGWSKSRVDRFISQLVENGMVGTARGTSGGTGQMIITVCNYDAYQMSPNECEPDGGTEYGTAAGQQRDKVEEGKEITVVEEEIETHAPAQVQKVSPEFYEKLQAIINAPVPLNMGRVSAWIDSGATEQLIADTVARLIKKRGNAPPPNSMRYFDSAIAQAITEATQPFDRSQHASTHTGKQQPASDFGRAWAQAAGIAPHA